MKLLRVDGGCGRHRVVAAVENVGSPAFDLRFPGRDLVRVNVKMLSDLCDRSLALDRCDRTLALTAGAWFRLDRLLIENSRLAGTIVPAARQTIHSPYRPELWSHFLAQF